MRWKTNKGQTRNRGTSQKIGSMKTAAIEKTEDFEHKEKFVQIFNHEIIALIRN